MTDEIKPLRPEVLPQWEDETENTPEAMLRSLFHTRTLADGLRLYLGGVEICEGPAAECDAHREALVTALRPLLDAFNETRDARDGNLRMATALSAPRW